MVGRGTDDRQAGREVDTAVEGQRLEGDQALVVIHGQHGVETALHVDAEESVGRVGPEGQDFLFVCCLDGRGDGFDFLGAEGTAVTGVRIEAHHGNLRLVHAKVAAQRIVHQAEFAQDGLDRDGGADLGQRKVVGDHTYPQVFRAEEHQTVLTFEFVDEVLGMAGKSESQFGYGVLVEGGGHDGVDGTALSVCHGGLERQDGSFRAVGRRLADFHRHAFGHGVDDIDALGAGVFSRVDHVGGNLFDFRDELAVDAEETGRTVKDDDAVFEDPGVGERLDDHFVSDSVGVALGDAHYNLVFHCLMH